MRCRADGLPVADVSVADDIRRLGFRRWYERQLIESFAYLVTAFLALVFLLAGYESLAQLRGTPLFYLAIIVGAAAAGVLAFVAWRRFNVLLARAEQFANAAECAGCKTWGRFEIVGPDTASEGDSVEPRRAQALRVRCRRCGHGWRLG
jgi:hypothetical protein